MKLAKLLLMKLFRVGDCVILPVDGGFGAVFLQYLLGLNITKHTGKKIKFDTSWFDYNGLDCDKKFSRNLTIDKLFPNLPFDVASEKEIKFYKKHFRRSNPLVWQYNNKLFENKEPAYYEGYYSHYKYWIGLEKEINEAFDFAGWNLDENNKKFKKEIEDADFSVGVHVRRGDFVNLGWCCLTKDYYINAIKLICNEVKAKLGSEKKAKFFFFSNDYDYVKNEILSELENVDYALVDVNDNDTGHFDWYLMSKCCAQIVANSTFSISASLLSQAQRVFAPMGRGASILL